MALCNFGHFALSAKYQKTIEARDLKLCELTGNEEKISAVMTFYKFWHFSHCQQNISNTVGARAS